MNWLETVEMYLFVMSAILSGIGLAMLVVNGHPHLALGLLPLAVGLCVFGAIRMSKIDRKND